MSSINTNIAAMTALQSLSHISGGLDLKVLPTFDIAQLRAFLLSFTRLGTRLLQLDPGLQPRLGHRRQPEVRDCAVVGLASDGNAEPCAALLLRESADPAEVVKRANAVLAEFQHIRHWLVWPGEDFPRTSTQKPRLNLIQEFAQARLRQQGLKVQTRVVRQDSPGAAILEEARQLGVDVVALATHGRGGLGRILLGSVADKVLRGATMPVLIHRPVRA